MPTAESSDQTRRADSRTSGGGRGPRSPRDHRLRFRTKAIIVVVTLVLVVGLIPQVLSVMMAWRRHNTDPATSLGADVGIVLGAEALADGTPSEFLKARLVVAKQLYDLGKIKVILVSGDGRAEAHNEPAVMKAWLVKAGVPADRVVEDPYGYSTYDTCARAKRVYTLNMVVLISQSYHLDRAVTTCSLVGIDGVYGVGDETMKSAHPGTWWAGVAREIPARTKMVYEYVTEGNPVVSDVPNDSVKKALAAAG